MEMKNYSTFKKMMAAVFFLLLAYSGTCQTWSEPQPFITGDSDKANIWIGHIANNDFLAVWEQSNDTLSTAICYQLISGSVRDSGVLVSEPNVHFKNPVICNVAYGIDTVFIFFQKVTENLSEIYFIKFARDGFYAEPSLLSVGGTNNSLVTTPGSVWQNYNYVAWKSDDHLLVSKISDSEGQFSPSLPDTVFNGEILDTRFREQELYWITRDADSSHILYQNGWKEPIKLFTANEIGCLRGENNSEDSRILAFSYKNEEAWHINNLSYYPDTTYFHPLGISSTENFDFGVMPIRDLVDRDLGIYNMAYVYDTLGFDEIFINDFWPPDQFHRLSWLETTCRNPRFFQTQREQHGFRVDLVFEAFIDGNWQFYKSEAFFAYGSINEKENIDGVSVYPNPATDYIHIQNEKETNLTIEIFDMNGKRVYQDVVNEMEIEIKTIGWNGGIYFVKISDEDSTLTRKLILN
jgi:hypothetical protein